MGRRKRAYHTQTDGADEFIHILTFEAFEPTRWPSSCCLISHSGLCANVSKCEKESERKKKSATILMSHFAIVFEQRFFESFKKAISLFVAVFVPPVFTALWFVCHFVHEHGREVVKKTPPSSVLSFAFVSDCMFVSASAGLLWLIVIIILPSSSSAMHFPLLLRSLLHLYKTSSSYFSVLRRKNDDDVVLSVTRATVDAKT